MHTATTRCEGMRTRWDVVVWLVVVLIVCLAVWALGALTVIEVVYR